MFGKSDAFSGYSVDDIHAAKDFYGDVLGLDVEVTMGGYVLDLTLGTGAAVMLYAKEDHEPATFTVLNFVTEDIDQAVQGLTEQGVTLERYEGFDHDEIGIVRGRATGEGPDIAWFQDPAGNVLSVLQEP